MSDPALLRLASRQHGLVTTAQLDELGFTRPRVRHLLRRGVLFRVHRGVYAVAGSKDTFEFRVMAATLAGGNGAVASHRCAAALYNIRRIGCDGPVISVSGRAAPRLTGIESHRRDILTAVDRVRIAIIPVTSPAWTILDLAGTLDLSDEAERSRLGGAIDDVIVRKLTSIRSLERLLRRIATSRLRGVPVLEQLVAERGAGKKPTETGLEDELLDIFRRYGLPEPVRQHVVALPEGGRARFDAAYPELLLGFEADGDTHHKGLLDRMRDEDRDEQCRRLGWTVRRYATEDIRERPAGVADDINRVRALALAA